MARQFDPTTSDRYILDHLPLDVAVEQLTMAARFNLDITGVVDYFLSVSDAAGLNYHAIRRSSLLLIAESSEAGSAVVAIPTHFATLGVWDSIVGIFTADNDRVCIAGGDIANRGSNTESSIVTGIDHIIIGGKSQDLASPFDGGLADLAIWRTALSFGDVIEYHQGVPPSEIRPGDLIFNASLEDGDERDLVTETPLRILGSPSPIPHPPKAIRSRKRRRPFWLVGA